MLVDDSKSINRMKKSSSKLINLTKGEKIFFMFAGCLVILKIAISTNTQSDLAVMVVLIALMGFYSIENNYYESKIEENFNLILSILAKEEKLSRKQLKVKVEATPIKGNEDFLLIKWKYYKMVQKLVDLGFIETEIDFSEERPKGFYKITDKGLQLAKRQEEINQ